MNKQDSSDFVFASDPHKEFCMLIPKLNDAQCEVLIKVLDILKKNGGRYPTQFIDEPGLQHVLSIIKNEVLYINAAYAAAIENLKNP